MNPLCQHDLARDVPIDFVDEFLAGWRNAEQSVTTDTGPVRSYLRSRRDDELKSWDVLVPSLAKGEEDEALGIPIVPARRYVDLIDLHQHFMSFSGKRMRVASRGIEKAGVDAQRAAEAERAYREEIGKSDEEQVNYPDSIYRRVRDRGLLILHYVKATPPKGEESAKEVAMLPEEPAVAWGISLPVSSRPSERVEYVVNTVRYRELFGDDEEDDGQEAALENE